MLNVTQLELTLNHTKNVPQMFLLDIVLSYDLIHAFIQLRYSEIRVTNKNNKKKKKSYCEIETKNVISVRYQLHKILKCVLYLKYLCAHNTEFNNEVFFLSTANEHILSTIFKIPFEHSVSFSRN